MVMKPFDHFKTIERYRRQVKELGYEYSHTSSEWGTITYNTKRWMSAALFYREYVREYGWEFCEKEAEKSPITTADFIRFCHFFEWEERNNFEFFLISKGAEDRYEYLKEFVPIFNGNDLEHFINEHLNSQGLVNDTLILYAWIVESYDWNQKRLEFLEQFVIEKLLKSTKSGEVISRVRKATNGKLDLSPIEVSEEKEEPERIQLDGKGLAAVSMIKNGANLFITGKAGTGKTTLLREILRQVDKKIAVVAPTGVAAKNAVGITIHSFLRLPTAPYFPGIKNAELYKLKKSDVQVINNVEIIIIDEVSMVRCDVLDAMDDVLRHYRKSSKPFGGVQLVMFGDLFQLMPVAPDKDWEILKKHYDSPYFFSSNAYQRLNSQMLELTKVYRQKESDFITILNNIREGVASLTEINILNTRFDKWAINKAEESIILTTHNRRAKGYNWDRLQKLPGDIQEFKATVSGWFPSDEYPAAYTLQLKVGAKVMFVKNDTVDHSFYNGMLGIVKEIGQRYVEVEAEGKLLFVIPQYWEHQRYIINKETKKLDVEVTGSFVQLPLMLAWAVTIHKSQGLTFDKVVIDAERAFTFGQVYVALSRCRTLKGIMLATRITDKCIKADDVVKKYMTEAQKVEIEGEEEEYKRKYLSFKEPEDRTLFYLKSGFSIDEIVKQCNEIKPIVLSHVAKLVAKGKLEGRDFVPTAHFEVIASLFDKHGINADRKLIRCLAPDVEFAEIEIVRAQLSRVVPNFKESKTSTATVSINNSTEGKSLVLEIGPKTFEKIRRRKKTSYKKIIYKQEDAQMFFKENKVNLSDVSGKCPYTLIKHDKVRFVSSETSDSIEKIVKSISVEASEVSPGNIRWIVDIDF